MEFPITVSLPEARDPNRRGNAALREEARIPANAERIRKGR